MDDWNGQRVNVRQNAFLCFGCPMTCTFSEFLPMGILEKIHIPYMNRPHTMQDLKYDVRDEISTITQELWHRVSKVL
jgi:hypothetical protein